MYLDSLTALSVEVGYGEFGMHGSLGYEGKRVTCDGQDCSHSFSTHPPARLRFHLGRQFATFTARVFLNSDVPPGASHATFIVLADGRQVAIQPYIRAGDAPQGIRADVSGAEYLELVVKTTRWEYCHAVWLEPQLGTVPQPIETLTDCLGRAEIQMPERIPSMERCITTVVSSGFESLLDDMLGSLSANGHCNDAGVVVFVLDTNEGCERVARKHGAYVIQCRSRARLSPGAKAVMYSAARVVDAGLFLCLDADMLVLGDLRPVFAALEVLPEESILCCSEGNDRHPRTLTDGMRVIYQGNEADLRQLSVTPEEAAYPLVVNDGLFAGSRSALLALDGVIRAMPKAAEWTDGHKRVTWRNQFIFNLALARLRCGVELDSSYNVQLHVHDVQFRESGARLHAEWQSKPARVLHFSGGAKHKYPNWQGRFAGAGEPLAGVGAGDAYAEFLSALRAWVGRYGIRGLAWSFYGLRDGNGARVADPSTLPLLATLHYIIRSNGFSRVIETGTARGISAACLASAVAHRKGAKVVTLDPYSHEGREELWKTLPYRHRDCIEARCVDSVEGMMAALQNGERYDAALLDSLHTQEQVWAEFEVASQIVADGGLILVHDACNAKGTVEGALRRIEQHGYGVVRLWTTANGAAEDDHLGLALIENRSSREDG